MTTTPWDTARLEQLDPRTLLLDRNSRTITDLETEDPELVASVRRHGVKLPILAARVDAQQVRVLDGHSRTIAAALAVDEHPTVPVLIIDITGEQDWELLRDQWIANEVRRGYSPADKARLMEALTLFGLSTADVAQQLSTTPETVEAGLAVRRSAKAAEATLAHPQLDVLQLAAIAEFEDDPAASARLSEVLGEEPQQFDHTVARLRQRRHATEERDRLVVELRDAGARVIDVIDNAGTMPLHRLLAGKEDRARLDQDNHATCPGHIVAVTLSYSEAETTYGCENWRAHGHLDAWTTTSAPPRGSLSEAEKADRRRVRENNEAWRAAQTVRRTWLRTTLFAAKKPPKRAQQYVLAALGLGGPKLTQAMSRGNRHACKLLGLREPRYGQPSPITGRAKRATSDQALISAIAIVVGAFEEALDSKAGVDTWRRPTAEDELYFAALCDWGYVLSPVEQLVLTPRTDARAA
jgi:ParB family chromosome partitioning protein